MPAKLTGGATLARPDFPCAVLEGDACARYAVQGCIPTLALLPESEDQAAQALAACDSAGLAVAPWGGGTLQALGHPPERLDVVLSMERLDQIVTYEPADLTISVQAGCTLQKLQAALGVHGQMLPFDAAYPHRATIGGVVAANLAGPRRFGPGSYRDLLIGIVVAAPDGTVTKGGGLVVKNVSGYDLMKLHLGALGTLGLILRLNFKVLTQPVGEATAYVAGPQSGLLALSAELAGSQLAVDSLELVGPGVPATEDEGWRLAVRLTGSINGLARKRREVEQMARDRTLELDWSEGDAMRAWWQACSNFLAPGAAVPDEALLRVATLPTQLGELIEHVERQCGGAGTAVLLAAHAGTGTLFFRLTPGAGGLARTLPALQESLAARWGQVTILASPPDVQRALDVWGTAPISLPLMRTIKEQFDPKRTLNPGRYVGRI